MGPKILHVAYSLDRGGLETLVLGLCRAQYKAGARPEVLTLARHGSLEPKFAEIDVKVHRLVKGEGFDPGLATRISSFLKEHRPDIVHTHNSAPWIYAAPVAAIHRTPVVHTQHSHVEVAQRGLLWMERIAACFTTAVVADSEEVGGFLRNRQRIGRTLVVPNGVDTNRFSPGDEEDRTALRGELGVEPSTIVAICVARLSPEKGHAFLLDAVAQAVDRGADLHLVLVGDGEERPVLVDRASASPLDDRVTFLGDREDVPELLRGSDLFVLGSRSEGMPLAILEAMSAGLPCVATDVGGVAETIVDGETGLLAPSGDADRFSSALLAASRDSSLRAGMRAKARARAVSRFSIEAMADRYARLYDDVVSGNLPPRGR